MRTAIFVAACIIAQAINSAPWSASAPQLASWLVTAFILADIIELFK